ncbi:MAG TPA: metallophosphoesterase [Vicinamibacterales bacterium]|nr:metallophosphoesterase [Vicinamibacterales bacterium]
MTASVPFGALGDIHGDFATVRRIMERHREVPFWLCVGDVATADGHYEPLPAPVYFIKGNNENFDRLASGDLPPHLHHIPNGTRQVIGGVTVAGLGGTFAPTMYERAAADLPHPKKSTAKATELADRRRHFVREEVEACRRLEGVDVFLSHEAPRPFRSARGNDAGKTPINEVLAAMKPKLHLFGHHHRFAEGSVQGVRSVCLDVVSRSYLVVDANTMACEQRSTA